MSIPPDITVELEHKSRALSYVLSLMAPQGARTGQDSTRSVTVSLDESGRTTDLQLAFGWTNRIEQSDLAAAIDEAARAARQQNLDDFVEAIGNLPDDLADVRVPTGFEAPQPPASAPLTQVTQQGVEDLLQSAHELEAQMDALAASAPTGDVQLAAPEPTADHPVTFLTDGHGGLLQIRIDDEWLAGMVDDEIGDALNGYLMEHLERKPR